MLKRTITYKDLDGNDVTEDFYFNLTVAELTEMELSAGEQGLKPLLEKIVADKDGKQIIATFKDIVSKSYGRRSEDGKAFIKSSDISTHFLGTDAYSQIFMELVTDAEKAVDFIKGIVPANLGEKLDSQLAAIEGDKARVADGEKPLEAYSREELLALSDEDFEKLAGKDPQKWSQSVLQVAFQRKS